MKEYTIDVPDGLEQEFEALVTNLGANIVNIKTLGDPEAVLAAMRAANLAFVEGLFAPKEPKLQAQIDQNYQGLLDNYLLRRDEQLEYRGAPQLDMPTLRQSLHAYFLLCNIREPYIKTDITPRALRWDREILRPNDVQLFALRHGLDGKVRSLREVGQEMGNIRVNGTRLRPATTHVRNYLQGQRLIFASPALHIVE